MIAAGRSLPTLKESGQMLLTFMLAVFGWIIFRSETIAQAWQYIKGMFDISLFTMPFVMVGLKKTLLFSIIMLVAEWFSREKSFALQFG